MTASGRLRRIGAAAVVAVVAGAALPAAASAAPFTVTNLADADDGTCDADCSLREAINAANAAAGADDIDFAVFGTIPVTSALPAVSDAVTIDGRDGGTPGVEIDGSATSGENGLQVAGAAAEVVVRGLSVTNFEFAGVAAGSGADLVLQTSRIGVDLTGDPAGNGLDGVFVNEFADQVTIGGTGPGEGNVISANEADGIYVSGAGPALSVHGNRIGTGVDGDALGGDQAFGVVLAGSGHTVGGSGVGEGNLIAGHPGAGVLIVDPGTSSNAVEGNVIGLAADGQTPLSNAVGVALGPGTAGNTVGGTGPGAGNVISGNGVGVLVSGDSQRVEGNLIGTTTAGDDEAGNDLGVLVESGADGAVVGGTTAGARNVVSGNRGGIAAAGPRTRVIGNHVGLAHDGLTTLGNETSGVFVERTGDDSDVGGPAAGEGNLIAGNGNAGVVVRRGVSGVRVRGNRIGLNKDGQPRRNLTVGIRVFDAADNTVGGNTTAEANTIAFNGAAGINIARFDPSDPDFEEPTGNEVMRNSLYGNGGLGIDLSGDVFGRTHNDAGDADTGANGLQNFPDLATAHPSGAATAVTGSLTSKPNATYRLRFFSNPPHGDEAEVFVGEQTVTTNGSGKATFTFTATPAVALDRTITATATDPGGNTSELSDPVTVRNPPPASPPPAGPGPDPGPGPGGSDTAEDPRRGILGFRTTSFRVRGSFVQFRVTSRVDFDSVIRINGREGQLASSRPPAFRTVRTTLRSGATRTIRLRVPAAQRRAIKRALRKRSRTVRRPSIRIANLTTGASRHYKPRLVVKR